MAYEAPEYHQIGKKKEYKPSPSMDPVKLERIYRDSETVRAAMSELGIKNTDVFYRLLRQHGIEPGYRLVKRSPLTDEQCRELMELKGKMTAKAAGELYGAAKETVRSIWNYERRLSATEGL